ncbi:MAG: hypothetical protein A3C30_05280 [Candidatus Levybacteria bacterium RIFCSPHIGHO2_02_FULL_40_18]|nr:MAG: hypothetical protein A2869_02940 [Candidatus Levybacteria bacterium RIFCSPHIGHO2_01_FULL_40_58]OGH26487.1 MAG: hypothetical protein A3C30_05280 [Candidatus Levybacteria bacterium RIFCSPHIGHO2_02_FULL_40_18]OGH31935.1 MAG: hypothetical protein A3E43_01080 [Candidatus Levybacteria bacterium RIFCSPHIGHO2_12_FULL_40_31]OGH40204.1 MAG: hypothetical protein A2894_05175 [Candidatus Levybacteria bacterium RIFCSPLOWO2_01_FULL_40_64]OGH49328.1 MAG: hypothetical protein A3I54_01625 [Candidatus Lev
MAHLAQVAREFRIGLKLLAASFAVIAILFIFFTGGQIVKNIFFPTPPPPPEQKFGKLPQVTFPAQNPQNFEYRINTLTGKLPIFTDACIFFDKEYHCQMKVYRVKKKEPSLVALKSARDKLKLLGFTENEARLSEEEYQWSNSSGQAIRMNILTGNFKILSNFLSEPLQPLTGEVARKEGAYEVVTRLLTNLDLEIEDLDKDISTLTYFKLENGALTKAQSLNEANFARLDLFQKNLDDHKIYYPGLTESIMHFLIKGDSSLPIVNASFSHFTPDEANSSTYPIKTAEVAFEDLKQGNALVFADNKGEKLIDITDVSLGYYIGDESQQYFLPIVIFKGKGFTAYVQAIP